MTIDKILRTCRAIKTLHRVIGGVGQIRARHIAWWMSQSKSQTYRDLIWLERAGLVNHVEKPYKNTKAIDWFLTDKGFEFVNQRELISYE